MLIVTIVSADGLVPLDVREYTGTIMIMLVVRYVWKWHFGVKLFLPNIILSINGLLFKAEYVD